MFSREDSLACRPAPLTLVSLVRPRTRRTFMSFVRKFLTWAALVVAAALLAAVYGALHDQLSYTVSPEYFTRFKFVQFAFAGVDELPPRIGAAVVGALATWWVGAIAGAAVGGAGFGQPTAAAMARSTLRAFARLAVIAAVAGLV